MSEIASYAGLEIPVTTIHLNALVDAGFLARDRPVDNPDGRKTRYRVADPFMRFQMGRVLP